METPDQHLKAMLEMSFSPHSTDSSKPETSSKHVKDEGPETTHKLVNKIHRLEKDVLYWQDKV